MVIAKKYSIHNSVLRVESRRPAILLISWNMSNKACWKVLSLSFCSFTVVCVVIFFITIIIIIIIFIIIIIIIIIIINIIIVIIIIIITARSHEACKPRDSSLYFSNRPETWQAPRQQRCLDVYHISERYDHYNPQISWLWDFGGKTPYHLMNRVPGDALYMYIFLTTGSFISMQILNDVLWVDW